MAEDYIPAQAHEMGMPPMPPDDDEPVGARTTEVPIPTAPAAAEPAEQIEINVIDDTPVADRGRPTEVKPNVSKTYVAAETLQNLPEEVRKRLNELNFQANTHRRAAEEKARDLAAAEQMNVYLASKLKQRSADLHGASKMGVEFANQKAQSDVQRAQERFETVLQRQADGQNVAKELAEATLALSKAQTEASMMSAIPVSETPAPDPDVAWYEQQTAKVQAERARQAAAAPPPIDPNAQQWLQNNSWFVNIQQARSGAIPVQQAFPSQEDAAAAYMMADAAINIENALRQHNNGNADYQVLDAELKRQYPDLYSRVRGGERSTQHQHQQQNTQHQRTAAPKEQPFVSPVAGVTRVRAAGKTVYNLPQRIIDRCARLGIDPKEYIASMGSQD